MKNILFSFGMGCAVGGLILSIANLAKDIAEWLVDRRERKKNDGHNKNP